jgi:hypothetical protein
MLNINCMQIHREKNLGANKCLEGKCGSQQPMNRHLCWLFVVIHVCTWTHEPPSRIHTIKTHPIDYALGWIVFHSENSRCAKCSIVKNPLTGKLVYTGNAAYKLETQINLHVKGSLSLKRDSTRQLWPTIKHHWSFCPFEHGCEHISTRIPHSQADKA